MFIMVGLKMFGVIFVLDDGGGREGVMVLVRKWKLLWIFKCELFWKLLWCWEWLVFCEFIDNLVGLLLLMGGVVDFVFGRRFCWYKGYVEFDNSYVLM